MRIRRSTHRGRCLPASFRPQGLVTLSTVFALRIPVGFISHRQRSWDSPFGAFPPHKVSGRFQPEAPTDRFALECSRRRSGWPAYRALASGFLPLRGSLTCGNVFSAPPAGCSPGFRPSRAYYRRPCPDLRRGSPHALVANCASRPNRACASGSHQPTARHFRISARGRCRMRHPF